MAKFSGMHDKALKLAGDASPISALLLNGQIALDDANHLRAKDLYLTACRLAPSCTSCG